MLYIHEIYAQLGDKHPMHWQKWNFVQPCCTPPELMGYMGETTTHQNTMRTESTSTFRPPSTELEACHQLVMQKAYA